MSDTRTPLRKLMNAVNALYYSQEDTALGPVGKYRIALHQTNNIDIKLLKNQQNKTDILELYSC